MGYAVAELPYLSQFAINVTLHHPVCLVREYAQQCFLPHTVVATCKKVYPKAERERSHHLVIGINAFTRKVLIGFLYRFLVISQQTTGSTLVHYPILIAELLLVMFVYRITEHDLKQSYHAIETLTQLHVALIEPYCFALILSASLRILIQTGFGKCFLAYLVLLFNFFA